MHALQMIFGNMPEFSSGEYLDFNQHYHLLFSILLNKQSKTSRIHVKLAKLFISMTSSLDVTEY